jgi:phosphoribosylaminoimidazole-succinocarboxamide synthase
MLAESYLRSGKVRDLHRLNDGRLLLIASDRISAFDVVLPTMVPDKGRVLTGMARFWFAETAGIVPNHLLATDVAALEEYYRSAIDVAGVETPDLAPLLDGLGGRMMICQPAHVVPVEAVVRGYLAGSGWKEYQASGTVCGIALPPGLRESDRLAEPIFTPATKAEAGEHDENISFDRMIEHISAGPIATARTAGPLAEAIRDQALRLYRYAAAITARRGILLADTKFEFGLAGHPMPPSDPGPPEERLGRPDTQASGESFADPLADHLILIDEALTPDSSRFWDAATYEPGRAQASFDKQFVRDWLETQPWDKSAPGPALPDVVVEGTRARYVEAYERITEASFERYLKEDVIAS